MTEILFSHIVLFFKALWIEQKVIDVYGQDTIFIVVWLNNILSNDDFLKRIVNLSERSDFLNPFCFIRQRIGRLDIIPCGTKIANKINFQLLADYLAILVSLSNRYHTYIYTITTHTKFIINHIFHGVGLFKLTEVNSGITKSQIRKVVFFGSFNICFSFDIISLG